MARWLRASASIAALAVLFGCAAPTPRETAVNLKMHPLGTTVQGGVMVAGKRIPLDRGDWTVIGTGVRKSNDGNLHVSYMLMQTADGKVSKAVEVFSNIGIMVQDSDLFGGGGPKGWLTHGNCVRDDMHFKEVRKNIRLGAQDCWWVNHWRMHRSGAGLTEHWKEARKYLADNAIPAALDMIGVSYRMANKRDYLTVNYFFDPNIEGQNAPKDIYWNIHSWVTSEWHPNNVRTDANKQQYIDSLIAWGRGWHGKVKSVVGID